MNKTVKYILGFVTIFIAAVICVFGIIKYEEAQKNSTTNNKNSNLANNKNIKQQSSSNKKNE